jgi:hypothetical protein
MGPHCIPSYFLPRLQVTVSVRTSELCLAAFERSVPQFFYLVSQGINVQILEDHERDYNIEEVLLFLESSLKFSSRKDRLVEVVHETLSSSCLRELATWSDEKAFQTLPLLVAITCLRNEVSVMFF